MFLGTNAPDGSGKPRRHAHLRLDSANWQMKYSRYARESITYGSPS